MRARRRTVVGLLAAAAVATVLVPAPTPVAAEPAQLPGAFSGEMLCDRGFETEGQTGPTRPNLSGPCWFDFAGEGFTGMPRFFQPEGTPGDRVLELCGYTTCTEAIGQPITVPYGITEATLTAKIQDDDLDTVNDPCDDQNGFEFVDYGAVVVDMGDSAGSAVNFVVYCEDFTGEQQLVADVTDAMAQIEGQETYVQVAARTSDHDAGEIFYIDDVSLVVEAAGQAMTTYPRNVSLMLRRHLKAVGRITSSDANAWGGCFSDVTVQLQRKKDGEWVTLPQEATTDSLGNYKVGLPDRQGTYRAAVAKTQLTAAYRCASTKSVNRTHTH